jgi:hypothetical protein
MPTAATDDVQSDSASISAQGQRLAALDPASSQVQAVAAADELVRRIVAGMAAGPQGAASAHQPLDPARVAALLEA